MSALAVAIPFPVFTDRNGEPLESGNIYIGVVNLNPKTNPQTVYWDAAMTIVAAQPIKTLAGYPVYQGTPTKIYTASSDYSMSVFDKNNNLVFTALDSTGISASTDYITYNQGSAGADDRTLTSKLQDILSVKDFGAVGDGVTDDTTAITAAVAEAYVTDAMLYWPDGEYLTTANIDDFHNVRHFGTGSVTRTSNTFYVSPTSSQSNTLFVSASGLSTNDGFSTLEPMTLQAALTALSNYGPMLNGKWNVVLAAGTYTTAENTFPYGLRSEYPVVITGPDVGGSPNVPTAILDGTSDITSFGIQARNGSSLYVKNIKFINRNNSGAGIAVTNGCFLATENVHTDNCYDGILCYSGRLYVSGGIFTMQVAAGPYPANYSAIKSMFNTTHSIGFKYNIDSGLAPADGVGNGPNISAATRASRGVFIQENSTGHVECCTFNNLIVGINIVSSGRAHSADNNFKLCGSAYEVEYASNIFDGPSNNNTYNAGTANANDQVYRFYDSSVDTSAFASALNAYIVKTIFTPSPGTVTGTLTETTLHTFTNYLRGYEFTRFGTLRARVIGTLTGTAGTKAIRMRIGGLLVPSITFAAGANGVFVAELVMVMSDFNTQRNYSFGTTNGNSSTVSGVGECNTTTTAHTFADGVAKSVTITGELGNTADTITIDYIELIRGGS